MKKKKVKGGDLVYEADKYVYNFQHYEKIRYFGKNIFARKIILDNVQSDLINHCADIKKGMDLRDIAKKI